MTIVLFVLVRFSAIFCCSARGGAEPNKSKMEAGRSRFIELISGVKVTVVFAFKLAKEFKLNEAVLFSEFSDGCTDELSRFELSVEEYEYLGI